MSVVGVAVSVAVPVEPFARFSRADALVPATRVSQGDKNGTNATQGTEKSSRIAVSVEVGPK